MKTILKVTAAASLLTACSQTEVSSEPDIPLWAKSPFDTLSPEEKRAWKENTHERLAANEAFMVEEAARQKVKLQEHIENLKDGFNVLYFNHKGINEFMEKTVPNDYPGEGMKYYKSLVIKKKNKEQYGATLEATLTISDNDIDELCYKASLWNGEGEETHLHTWDLLQTRIAHTRELMHYMMELAGDVEGEHLPSRFNYEVIVRSESKIHDDGVWELGRRIKRCSQFGLFHLPHLKGPNFEAYHHDVNKRRVDPYHKG